jgi:hypothetical protein
VRAARLILAAVLGPWPIAACATRTELTAAERAAFGLALPAEAAGGPRRFTLVLDARPAQGPGGDLHLIVDGERVCLVLLDPLGVALKSILTPELLWVRAREPGGRQIEASCPGGDERVCRLLAALHQLRPFSPRPFPVASAARAWLEDGELVVEAPAGGAMVERRTYDRADLRCVRRAILRDGRTLAVVHHGATADALELALPDLGLTLRLKVLERDDDPTIAPGAFTPG